MNNELVEPINNLYPKIPNLFVNDLGDIDKIIKESKELI
jgi:hypothetical protein